MASLHLTNYSAGVYQLSSSQRTAIEHFVHTFEDTGLTFVVNGFSSSTADHERNLALSTARAAAVSELLVRLGVANDKIEQRSFGERLFSGNAGDGQITQSVLIHAE
ncbi:MULTISPECIES: OmpA family protein [Rhizobium]|uniref:OmpA family protein n=1 Tax=Rhizobium phaseoli TaxID=396 RepID=A0A7X6F774_9HYPH|nr:MULTISPECIES: OmpA family protein [Rhizobium]MDE8763081.1 OmpA family protein [Rhizobium sp. CBK13]NKF13375.1 OmpA family protein [Rhizobium phaseoli]QPK12570.1 OmpA family protein [Rhizobium phaseoli]